MSEESKKENRPTLTNKTSDGENFKLELENTINLNISLRNIQQLEAKAKNFTKKIQHAAWNNTKEITHRTLGNNYPAEIKKLVKEKRKARRKWQQTRDPSDKTILNNKTQKLKRQILKLKEESINQSNSKQCN